ncbi:MAG: DUF1045 domain-containing protein [Proteobacteria bacterium]|nr:DUF1045 domain-containing protein [Pseudomonadota bacterium]
MTTFSRYAVYYAPRPGAFAEAGAVWLGRNCITGFPLAQPKLQGTLADLAPLTTKPRKYGFHGTLRAPFRLAEGEDVVSVVACLADLAKRLEPARCDGLEVGNPYGFGLALKPVGDEAEILKLAAAVVEHTDYLRAPLRTDEIAQREQSENLNPRQRSYLHRWGYPMVMEELCFQLTLSNRIDPNVQTELETSASLHFNKVLPVPFVIEDLCLFGEEADTGMFRLLYRFPLNGSKRVISQSKKSCLPELDALEQLDKATNSNQRCGKC